MKRTILAALLSGALIMTAFGGEVDRRQRRQQKRIGEGVESGQLTAKETAKLERKEANLRREIHNDRTDGNGLTPKEKAKINRQENRLSRDIYRQKHDGQTQK